MTSVKLINLHIWDDDTWRPSEIAIVDGVIRGVGERLATVDLPELDGHGAYALPGFINAHDHLYSVELRHPIPDLGLQGMREWIDRRDAPTTLAYMIRNGMQRLREGITIERDLMSSHQLNLRYARLVDDGVVPGPTVLAAGSPIVMTGGHVHQHGRAANGPWDCRAAVREQARDGADVIKIMASGGLSRYPEEDFDVCEFTLEELVAIVDESHARGLPTCSHAFGPTAVRRVLDAGVDSIEHGVKIAEEDLRRMAADGTGYVPTSSNMRRVVEIMRMQAERNPQVHERIEAVIEGVIEPHEQTIAKAIELGVKVAIGTDSTGSYAQELEIMMRLGMTPEQAIHAATSVGADICRIRAGRIAADHMGSVQLYRQSPHDHPETLTRPQAVVHRGTAFVGPVWDTWGMEAT